MEKKRRRREKSRSDKGGDDDDGRKKRSGSDSGSENDDKRDRSQTPEVERERRKKEKDYLELTRDVRTVFVTQLQIKCRKKDLKRFFEKVSGIKVNDIKLMADEITGRSKGLAYVELQNLEDLPKALLLNGQKFVWKKGKLGFPIAVQPSEAEKNYQHEKAKSAAEAHAAALAAVQPRTILISNLPMTFNKETIAILCKPIGELENEPTLLTDASGTFLGQALVMFKQPDQANKALNTMDGRQLNTGDVLSVKIVPNNTNSLSAAAGQVSAMSQSGGNTNGSAGAFAPFMGIGSGAMAAGLAPIQAPSHGPDKEPILDANAFKINAAGRQQLMHRLAASRGMGVGVRSAATGSNTIPLGVRQPSTGAAPVDVSVDAGEAGGANTVSVGAPVGTPSSCLVLKNMFDVAEETAQSGTNWASVIKVLCVVVNIACIGCSRV